MEAGRTPEDTEAAGLAVVVYSVLTSLEYEADGYLDKLRLHKAWRMLVVEAEVHSHFVDEHVHHSHWRMGKGREVI